MALIRMGAAGFNMDDGPYYSRPFDADIRDLPLQSSVELRRFGKRVYVLESRLLDALEGESVLVLKQADGKVRWKRIPVKPDGPLGTVDLIPRATAPTLFWGWRVGLKPAKQESGSLYIGPLGNFRFFYHSW